MAGLGQRAGGYASLEGGGREYLLTQVRVVVTYLRLFVFPAVRTVMIELSGRSRLPGTSSSLNVCSVTSCVSGCAASAAVALIANVLAHINAMIVFMSDLSF